MTLDPLAQLYFHIETMLTPSSGLRTADCFSIGKEKKLSLTRGRCLTRPDPGSVSRTVLVNGI